MTPRSKQALKTVRDNKRAMKDIVRSIERVAENIRRMGKTATAA